VRARLRDASSRYAMLFPWVGHHLVHVIFSPCVMSFMDSSDPRRTCHSLVTLQTRAQHTHPQPREQFHLPRLPAAECVCCQVERIRDFVPEEIKQKKRHWSKPAVKLAALTHRQQCGLGWPVSCTFRVDGEPRGRQVACGRVQLQHHEVRSEKRCSSHSVGNGKLLGDSELIRYCILGKGARIESPH